MNDEMLMGYVASLPETLLLVLHMLLLSLWRLGFITTQREGIGSARMFRHGKSENPICSHDKKVPLLRDPAVR